MPESAESPRAGSRWSDSWQGPLVHLLRVGLLIAILGLIRAEHVRWTAAQRLVPERAITLSQVQTFFAGAVALSPVDVTDGSQRVLADTGEAIGQVLQTAPASDQVVGFAGPTNLLIAVDEQRRVVGVDVLASADTDEHVADIRSDSRFLSAWNGMELEQIAGETEIDVVSGATLTSLAVIEGVARRFGSRQPSRKFPAALQLSEVTPFLANAQRLVARPTEPHLIDVVDSQGKTVGSVFRTSPACDHRNGYQGPTDLLVVLDRQQRVVGMRIRRSYDNRPYVDYVRDDQYFWSLFQDRTLGELARWDVEREPVEGVSGATMTSQALAAGLPVAASVALRHLPARPWMRVSARDLGSVVVLLGALWMSFTRRPVRRGFRRIFQIVVIVYLGFLNGDMVSQAVLVGWTRHGSPWRLAPGFSLLVAAAFLIPLLTKKQVYCHHICPFGAAQQIIRPRRRWRWSILPGWRRWLKRMPGLLLAVVLVATLCHWPLNLAEIEPFHAFVWRAAGIATLAIAAFGLLAAALSPMAYCRFGCPTGALLTYVRFHGRRRHLTLSDAWAALLFCLALALG